MSIQLIFSLCLLYILARGTSVKSMHQKRVAISMAIIGFVNISVHLKAIYKIFNYKPYEDILYLEKAAKVDFDAMLWSMLMALINLCFILFIYFHDHYKYVTQGDE